jgi:hypothetical protein
LPAEAPAVVEQVTMVVAGVVAMPLVQVVKPLLAYMQDKTVNQKVGMVAAPVVAVEATPAAMVDQWLVETKLDMQVFMDQAWAMLLPIPVDELQVAPINPTTRDLLVTVASIPTVVPVAMWCLIWLWVEPV